MEWWNVCYLPPYTHLPVYIGMASCWLPTYLPTYLLLVPSYSFTGGVYRQRRPVQSSQGRRDVGCLYTQRAKSGATDRGTRSTRCRPSCAIPTPPWPLPSSQT